ncbi:MAG: aminopeptidase P family N-terminal domain-containing protein [Acidimicrobiales bacterium]|nr:aminopeptidase P family N-terminal domain-containing protein [Acidimicrobiales bacterium]
MTADAALIAARRDRVLAAMAERDIDVLVLGRQDDANYASGMHRLWTAGTRPFGAGCLVVRETGRTHVLSGWDAGLPPTMTWDDLYPSTWNPRVMAANLAAIPGLADAKRIGTDEVSPSFRRAAGRLAPDAEVVPADDLMAAVRRHKLPAEIDRIRAACGVVWEGVLAIARHGAGTDEQLIGAAVLAMGRLGATIPSSAPIVRRSGADTVVDLGMIVDGYEGGLGAVISTHLATGDEARPQPLHLANVCQPGATGAALAAAAEHPGWLVRGVGMGFELPVIDETHGHAEILEPDMVLSVSDGDRREIVHITDRGPALLSGPPEEAS